MEGESAGKGWGTVAKKRQQDGFWSGLLVSLALSAEWSAPAWIALALHHWAGISLHWFWGLLGLWIFPLALSSLAMAVMKRAIDAPEPERPNKNPYSVRHRPVRAVGEEERISSRRAGREL